MNLPNILTLVRILLVPLFVIVLVGRAYVGALVIFCIASITDAVDGFLARLLRQQTLLGTYLDPLADKALVAASFVVLSVLGDIPVWLTVLVISRDIIILAGISVLSFMALSFEIRPTLISKATTALQFSVVVVVLAAECSPVFSYQAGIRILFVVTAFFTTLSGFDYIRRGFAIINREQGGD